ncbi:GAF and ANTAR domain-containing protein [Kocuria sp. M4R2S49]|uniref:GAF and ANTAR domain-containing protein n=1 Tax=Kocuria rhizosphaericola TaxID=3376284 RepID=UPI00378FE132
MSTDFGQITTTTPGEDRAEIVEADLAQRLSDLARTLQVEDDVQGTLEAMVHAALDLIPGVAEASISVARRRRGIESRAASGELPRTVDRLQEDTGEGPCMDAAYEERIVRVPDFRHEDRWPRFAPAALDAGATSMLAFQLYTDGDVLGALNVYGADFDAFTEESEEIGLLVAAHAAVALSAAQQVGHLHEALATRDLIGQAKGVLMERFKITPHEAFVILTTASSQTNTKLRDVAERLASTGVLTGEHPEEAAEPQGS